VDHDYLKSGDLKVFATSGITPWNGTYNPPANATATGSLNPQFDGTRNSAFKIYKVTDRDAGNAIFCATKNFTYSGNQNTAISATASPFGDKGFVIFHKGGDGAAFKKQQATNKSLLGTMPGQTDTGTNPDETADSILQQN
jgi:hypothetical protein